MRNTALLSAIFLAQSNLSLAGVLSGHAAIRCSAEGGDTSDCDVIRPSRLEGKFSALLGLDVAFNSLTPSDSHLIHETTGSTANTSATKVNNIRLKDASGFRAGSSLRLYILDHLGITLDAGYQWNSLGTDDDEQQSVYSQTKFNLSYDGSYVGSSFFLPTQKLDTLGLFGSLRRYSVSNGNVNMTLPFSAESRYKAKPLETITEMSIGCFLSVFYLSYSSRNESWKVTGNSNEKFSEIKSRSAGIELGVTSPVLYVWP